MLRINSTKLFTSQRAGAKWESRRTTPPMPMTMARAMPPRASVNVPRQADSKAGIPSITGVKSSW
ncbi:hypothetical protein D3C87_1834150 [compost metagenome]